MRSLLAMLLLLTASCFEAPVRSPSATDDAGYSSFDGSAGVSDSGAEVPDSGVEEPDAGVDVPDAGVDEPDSGVAEPDAGVDVPDTGVDEPDSGVAYPDAGQEEPDAGGGEPDAGDGCPWEEECALPASCVAGACVCPVTGCETVVGCSEEGVLGAGCQACLLACEDAYEPMRRERAELEVVAAAFREFRKDTGGWPVGSGDWNPDNPDDANSGGVDPTVFFFDDVALFSKGTYDACSEVTLPASCWNGPYLQPGENLVSDPWLDVWGKVRLFSIIPPKPLYGYRATVPDGAVVVWSRGPNGRDDAACTDTPCAQNRGALAQGLPSRAGGDDIIVVVGPSK